MLKKIAFGILILFLGLFVLNGIVKAEGVVPTPMIKGDYVPGEVIVGFNKEKADLKGEPGEAMAAEVAKQYGLAELKGLDQINARLYKIRGGKSVEETVLELKKNLLVRYAEPNYIWHIAGLPNDTYINNEYAIHNTGQTINGVAGTADADIDAMEAWDTHTGDGSVIVAVIDTGVALNHADLASRIVAGHDFVDNDDYAFDGNGHGTHVAGTIGAIGNNGMGVAGVNQNVKIMPIRVLNTAGSGTTANIASGFTWAADHGAQIMNASIQGTNYSQATYDAIKAANDKGVLLIAAAGNQGRNNEITHNYPSDYDLAGILGVASTDNNDAMSSFSNYGSTSIDVGAPGSNIYSTFPYRQLYEDFESAPYEFTVSGTYGNAWGLLNTGSTIVAYTDANWFAGWSRPNALEYLNSSVYNLSGQSQVTLQFDREGLIAEPTNGTCTDWFGVQSYDGSSWNLVWTTCGANTESGTNAGSETLDLSPYLGSGTNFQFRFVWKTSNLANWIPETMYLDNIELYVGSSSGENYKYLDGTSMATPNVAGVASLLKSYKPTATIDEIKNAILNTGDQKDSLGGKTVSGKRVNAAKAIASLKDTTAPNAPTNFVAAEGNKQIKLKWKNPDALDFAGVKILRKTSGYPKNSNDGKTVYQGTGTSKTDKNLKNGKKYYYSAFAYDSSGNFSSAASEFAAPNKVYLVQESSAKNVAVGDLDGNGSQEIILASRAGVPKINIVDRKGNEKFKKGGFYPFGTSYHCGVNVATGDLNNDGKDEIIAGLGYGCPSKIKIFNKSGKAVLQKSGIKPYSGKNGVKVASGDLNSDNQDEIVTAPAKGAAARVYIYGYSGKKIKKVLNASGFLAFPSSMKAGVEIWAADLNFNKTAEIIVVPQKGASAYVKVFKYTGKKAFKKAGFYPFGTNYKDGVDSTVGDINSDGYDEILAAKHGTNQADVYSYKGKKSSPAKISSRTIDRNKPFVVVRSK